MTTIRHTLIAGAASCVLALAVVPAAQAATFTVTKTDDTADGSCDSDCSLREAVIAANANAGISQAFPASIPESRFSTAQPRWFWERRRL